jgi:hypothetical protein
MLPSNGKNPADDEPIAVTQSPLYLTNGSQSFEDRLLDEESWDWKASKDRARITSGFAGFAAIMVAILFLMYTLRRCRKKRRTKR